MVHFLIYGHGGFLASYLIPILDACGYPYTRGESRIQNRESVEKEIRQLNPTHILNLAGITGTRSVDDCEFMKQDTILTNVVGTLSLVDLAYQYGIHLTNFATGCIYEYDRGEHPMPRALIGQKDEETNCSLYDCSIAGDSSGFTETDQPNFTGSHYSKTKIITEQMLHPYYDSVCLTLRVRMPLADDLVPRNFITKITRYEKVIDVPNSMTVMYDLLPIAIDLALKKRTGIFNFTNPGVISHNDILTLYKKYIDVNFQWQNFSLEEQAKILKAGRSNNQLDSTKLLNEYHQFFIEEVEQERVPIHRYIEAMVASRRKDYDSVALQVIPPILTSCKDLFQRMKQKQKQNKKK
jgi:dTDP-4-dehydrorhamnose reductase